MQFDTYIALAGLIVGFAVGLTGMGGGALMTPILVLLFKVQPLAAVSSDLVASFVMKPVGAGVHLRRRTVNWGIVGCLTAGSVPAALLGVGLLRVLGRIGDVQHVVQIALGVALLLAVAAIGVNAVIARRRHALQHGEDHPVPTDLTVRRLPTIAVGALGGVVVGMTSVGSGSLIIVMLLFLYPSLRPSQLVGTDLVQAIPLVGAAALGHLVLGDFRFSLTASLIAGAIPGVYLGAQISARAASRFLRPAIAFVLLASGLKLVQATNLELGVILLAALVLGPALWAVVHATNGLRLKGLPSSTDIAS